MGKYRNRFWGLFLIALVLVLIVELTLRYSAAYYLKQHRSWWEQEKKSDEITVLCLGESTTYGLWVSPEQSYPAQLERMLNSHYRTKTIRAVVPVHIGQNSSQIADRLEGYLKSQNPRLVIAMVGINNEWALGDTSAVKFLPPYSLGAVNLRVLMALDRLKLFKLFRHLVLEAQAVRHWRQGFSAARLSEESQYWRYPPLPEIYAVARLNRAAFVMGWHYDVDRMIQQSREFGARVLLMTYFSGESYLTARDFQRVAEVHEIPLARNDLAYRRLAAEGRLKGFLLPQDNWHPSEKGYELIAGNAFKKIVENDLLWLNRPGLSLRDLDSEASQNGT